MSLRYYNGGIIKPGYSSLLVPGAPTIGIATAGDARASVAFTAPTDIGGSAITSYRVVSSPGGFSAIGTASPITVTGLTNGIAYTFSVAAINSYGQGTFSAPSASVTPIFVPPTPSPVITSNLRVNLDAANYTSGSTWSDSSGNGLNATLFNNPTYTASNGSYFTFNGTNQYATTSTASTATSNVTMQVWVNITTPNKGCFVSNGNNSGSNGYGVGIGINTVDSIGSNLVGLISNVTWLPTGVTLSAGWQLISMVLTTSNTILLYINGTQAGSWTNQISSVVGGLVIANEVGGARYYSGKIGQVLLYTTALSQSQIVQNYDAIRARYGV